jgi:DNA ligase D-like protein (predicted 3'-phosphoesterase)
MITDLASSDRNEQSHQLQYCIQEHRAPHAGLHWDLQLELNGVAKSWALRKEPPIHLGVKRLAIPVNDHPLSYMAFHDPHRRYYVKLWDHGTYRIRGRRLSGLFVLTPFKENCLFYRLE